MKPIRIITTRRNPRDVMPLRGIQFPSVVSQTMFLRWQNEATSGTTKLGEKVTTTMVQSKLRRLL
jgi:hypothetical protein